MVHRPGFCRSLPHFLRYRKQYSRHTREIARGHRQFEPLIDPLESSEDSLPNSPDGLSPTEVFLVTFADDLADPLALVPCRPSIDGAATASSIVLGYMRRDLALATGSDKVGGIVGLVGIDRLGVGSGNAVEHAERCFAFADSISMRDHFADHQPERFSISTCP